MSERRWWEVAGSAIVPGAKLLFRLARDDRVPQKTRWFALGAIGYAVLPFDLIPDRIPLIGKVDDIGALVLAAARLVGDTDDDVIAELWDGDEEALEAFRGFVEGAADLIPARVRRLAAVIR